MYKIYLLKKTQLCRANSGSATYEAAFNYVSAAETLDAALEIAANHLVPTFNGGRVTIDLHTGSVGKPVQYWVSHTQHRQFVVNRAGGPVVKTEEIPAIIILPVDSRPAVSGTIYRMFTLTAKEGVA